MSLKYSILFYFLEYFKKDGSYQLVSFCGSQKLFTFTFFRDSVGLILLLMDLSRFQVRLPGELPVSLILLDVEIRTVLFTPPVTWGFLFTGHASEIRWVQFQITIIKQVK